MQPLFRSLFLSQPYPFRETIISNCLLSASWPWRRRADGVRTAIFSGFFFFVYAIVEDSFLSLSGPSEACSRDQQREPRRAFFLHHHGARGAACQSRWEAERGVRVMTNKYNFFELEDGTSGLNVRVNVADVSMIAPEDWRNPVSDLTGIGRCQSLMAVTLVPQGQSHSVISRPSGRPFHFKSYRSGIPPLSLRYCSTGH